MHSETHPKTKQQTSIQALNLRCASGIQKEIFSERPVASDAKADFENNNRNKFRKSNETNGESSIKLLQTRREEQPAKIPIIDFHQIKYQTDLNQKIAKCKHSKIFPSSGLSFIEQARFSTINSNQPKHQQRS